MTSQKVSCSQPRYRWVICALLFCATTSNYVDRQVLGILAPHLKVELGWSEIEYGRIVAAFQMAYAIGLFVSGWIVDRLGVRWGLMGAVLLWSMAATAHGFASKVSHFVFARFALGLTEAVNFPASIKSVKEWFSSQERALAIGIFNAGSNVGALITPVLVPIVTIWLGWRAAFYLVGGLGILWVLFAVFLLRSCPAPGTAIKSVNKRCSLRQQLVALRKNPVFISFIVAKFLTDPVWWFYLYWTPNYLSSKFGLNLISLGLPLVVMYVAADIGSIGGGWLSGRLIRGGLGVMEARLKAMLYCAVGVLFVAGLAFVSDLWIAVILLSVATICHQAWSANLFACVSDASQDAEVGTVVGVGGAAGALGGVVMAEVVGQSLTLTGSYVPLFVACSCSYIVAWMLFQIFYRVKDGGDVQGIAG
jgi:MFS transporter, ACS family, hexuronate transporter